jgi:hypothetical protein
MNFYDKIGVACLSSKIIARRYKNIIIGLAWRYLVIDRFEAYKLLNLIEDRLNYFILINTQIIVSS